MAFEKITRGFKATHPNGNIAEVKVHVHDVGFFIITNIPNEEPKQLQRKYINTVNIQINKYKEELKAKGYTEQRSLGTHRVIKNKDTGMYKVSY